jgi:PASTA domain
LRRIRLVPIVGHILDRGEHPSSRIAAVIAIVGALCLVVSGSSAAGQAVVPDVVGLNVDSAYDDLRDAGFAVQIDEAIAMDAVVVHQSSRPGSKGHAGSPVVLDLDVRYMGGRLPPGPTGPTRPMPRLVGKPLPDAVQTLQALGLLWSVAALPPLPPSMRPRLFDNYRVSAQTPAPGTRFRQTVVREIPGGLETRTSTVGLRTKLRPTKPPLDAFSRESLRGRGRTSVAMAVLAAPGSRRAFPRAL